MSALIGLYPRAWRTRYEAEVLDLLAERPITTRGRLDLVRGAVDAHLHPQVTWAGPAPFASLTPEDERFVRRLGVAALVGTLVWIGALAVYLQAPVVADSSGLYRDGAAALPLTLLAGLMLVAGLLGHVIGLADEARIPRITAVAAMPLLLIYLIAPWLLPIGALGFGLLGVHAVASVRARVWPVGAAALVVVSLALAIATISLGFAQSTGDRMRDGAWFALAFIALGPVWLAVGGSLLARSPAGRGAAAS